MHLFATCAFGLEKLVQNELKQLGYKILLTEDGRVTFEGDELAIVRANLWLRTAGRVHIKMGECHATTFDELFDYVTALPWEKFIQKNDIFPIAASSAKSVLHSESALQSIVKKSVVKRLQVVYNIDQLPEDSPSRYHIHVHFNKDHCVISIDTSGDSLHKRGYRSRANLAPIKESLAAALVILSGWKGETPLVDPFCGSGTILIEGAMIAQNMAPGLKRPFAWQTWPWITTELVQKAFEEARGAVVKKPLTLIGYDIDSEVIAISKHNAKLAGVDGIKFLCTDFQDVDFTEHQNTTFITNPPYGERLEEIEHVKRLYVELGKKFNAAIHSSLFLITPVEDFPMLIKRKETKNRKLYNGKIKCYLYSFVGN